MDSRFCKSCGVELPEDTPVNCPKCGAALTLSGIVKKQPILAIVASFIIPGLGQSYNGNALKGIGFFLGTALLSILSVLMYWIGDSYFEALFIGFFIFWIIGVYDAYRDAVRMNRGEIPEKKHQIWIFGAVAVVVVVILAVVFFLFLLVLGFSGLMNMNPTVVCVPGKGCIGPLQGEAVCNTTSQCIGSAQTRIEVRYYPDAIKFLDRALALDPDNTQALTLMGVARAKSGNLTGAIIPLDRAVAIDPGQSVAWENRGIVKAMSGKSPASRTDLEMAVTLPGNSSLSWYNLGVARSREGNSSEALDAFDHALMIDNKCTPCKQMMGKTLIALGQYDTALGIFDNVTTPGLEYIVSKEETGNALAGLKRYEESCMAFDASIEPHRFAVADLWSGVCNQTTRQCEPRRTTNEPLTAYDREFYMGLLTEYDNQLKTQQNDPDLWIKRGETMINLMRYDEAVTSFERSISIRPENVPAQNGKGVALFYAGNNTLALEAFDLAVRTDSGSIKSWNNGAFVFMKQGNFTKAAKTYQNALYYAHRQKDPQGTGDFLFDTAF